MTDDLFSGVWVGYYDYGPLYSEKYNGKKVDFFVNITLQDGELNGISEEEVTKLYMEKPAILTGFIEGRLISFIKQYPYYYWLDEKDEIQIDRSRKHPAIHYTGTFDPATNTFIGDWEMEIILERNIDGDRVRFFSGGWELRKAQKAAD